MQLKLLVFTIYFILPTLCHSRVILIDPGHGGEDCGAKAKLWGTKKKLLRVICEKDIALSIAKRIRRKLKKDFTVYLTRSIDRSISLEDRAKMADKISADIFISVHINSSLSRNSRGIETFYLDNHKDATIKKIEELENKNLKGSALIIDQILTDLVIERTAPQSKALAASIHSFISKNISKKYKLVDRGIKPAKFYVLALSKRPSILLEAGFLSNQHEVKKILSKKFQNAYANAVYKGIKKYFKNDTKISLF